MAFTQTITKELIDMWIPRTTQISMVELFAPVLAIILLGSDLCHKSVIILVDNEAAESALIKGYSSKEDLCELTGLFWDLCESRRLEVYIDRVSTDANIADGPSRDQKEFWKLAADLGWHRLRSWIPEVFFKSSVRRHGKDER